MTTPAVIAIEDCAAWVPASQHAAVVRENDALRDQLARILAELHKLSAGANALLEGETE